MKPKAIFSIPKRAELLFSLLFILCLFQVSAQDIQRNNVARITQFEVKDAYQDQFRKALSEYVLHALRSGNNVMAEAYSEKENPRLLWLIERWENKAALVQSAEDKQFTAITALAKAALQQPSKEFNVKDLEPLSKQQWRRSARKEDNPQTMMLFVNSKSGKAQRFKDVYHVAMPQFRSEKGVVTYQLSQLENDSEQFVTYEKFRSEAAFQFHLKFPPIKPVVDYLETDIKEKPFQKGLHTLIQIAPLTRE